MLFIETNLYNILKFILYLQTCELEKYKSLHYM